MGDIALKNANSLKNLYYNGQNSLNATNLRYIQDNSSLFTMFPNPRRDHHNRIEPKRQNNKNSPSFRYPVLDIIKK